MHIVSLSPTEVLEIREALVLWRNKSGDFAPRKGASLLSYSMVRPKELGGKGKIILFIRNQNNSW